MAIPASHLPALEFAQQQVSWFRENEIDVLGKPVRFFDPGSSEQYAAHIFARCLINGMIDPAQALDEARQGDALYVNALRLLGAMQVAGTIDLPIELRQVVTASLTDLGKPRRARRLETNYFRDIALTIIVQQVSDKFALTISGRSSRRPSACRIVADAAGMDYEAVRKAIAKFIKHI